jgi:ADP-ribose pyrophosphatase YjhB (NUDIX family)
MDPQWLSWTKRLHAIAQTGLAFGPNPYDQERYEEVRAIATEMMASGGGVVDPGTIAGLFRKDSGYATPKVDVRAGVIRDGSILLVRERVDGLWALPGGWADIGDRPSRAAEREVLEESGYEVLALKLVAMHDHHLHGHPPEPFHAYKFFFLCELTGGEAKNSDETDGVGFFPEDDLPSLSLPRVVPAQIAMLFEHSRHPELPTEFD